jgi:hypothetical protein
MSSVGQATSGIPHRVADLGRRIRLAVAAILHRRANARAKAICPVDSRAFTPLYTNGECPLCGWKPDAYTYRAPLFAPYDRYWGALGGIVALSAVMAIVVVIAYTHS